jgi:hypothetical protein
MTEFFRALPPRVEFRDVLKGQTYKASVVLLNSSAVSKRVSVSLPSNAAFDVKILNGEAETYMIAPGMV